MRKIVAEYLLNYRPNLITRILKTYYLFLKISHCGEGWGRHTNRTAQHNVVSALVDERRGQGHLVWAVVAELEHPGALSFLVANVKRNAIDNKITSCSGETQQYLDKRQDEISL